MHTPHALAVAPLAAVAALAGGLVAAIPDAHATATAPSVHTHTPTVSVGGCRVRTQATLSPGLTDSTQTVAIRYSGRLTGCADTASAPDSGTISAGETITIHGRRYQEPTPTATGSCTQGTITRGYDFARWSDGTQTIVQFTTRPSPFGRGDTLVGRIVPALRLPAAGDPSHFTTFRSTRFLGQSAYGEQALVPTQPSLCQTSGVTSAHAFGALVHESSL